MRALVIFIAIALASVAADVPHAQGRNSGRAGGPALAELRGALVHVGHGQAVGAATRVRWLGTGFLVDDRCTVVTAKHNVLGLAREGLLLRLQDPDDPGATVTVGGYVLHEDPGSDLLFLRFAESAPGATCSSKAFGHVPLAATADRAVLTGEDVLIWGYPAIEGERPSDVPILRKGIVASAELDWEGQPMLLLDLAGIPGFSGGPVIRVSTGEAIGVVFGPGRTDRRYDLEWATPITRDDHLRALDAARRSSR
jgi:S1-C subfamily serine protease